MKVSIIETISLTTLFAKKTKFHLAETVKTSRRSLSAGVRILGATATAAASPGFKGHCCCLELQVARPCGPRCFTKVVCKTCCFVLLGQAVKSGPSPEALRGRGNEKKKVAFIVWNWDTIHLLYYFLQIKWSPKVFKILSSNFWDCKGRVHVVQVSKLLSHPNSLRLGENSVHSSSHESHKRRSDGFEKMQKKSEKFRPNCDSISPVHRRNLGVCSWLTSWVPNMMSRLLLRYHESCCSSWSCICFSSSVGVAVLTVTVKFLGLGGGRGGGPLTVKYQLRLRGGGGGVSCFYSFGEPLRTWTYAMLTCIVYHVILLYSWTSQTYVHDNVWLKT